MGYIIKNQNLKNYFLSEQKWGFHFVLDIDDALIFKNKTDADNMLKKMSNLREYENIVIIPKKRSK